MPPPRTLPEHVPVEAGHLTLLERKKAFSGRGSVPDPAAGAYSTPPDPPSWLGGSWLSPPQNGTPPQSRPFGPRPWSEIGGLVPRNVMIWIRYMCRLRRNIVESDTPKKYPRRSTVSLCTLIVHLYPQHDAVARTITRHIKPRSHHLHFTQLKWQNCSEHVYSSGAFTSHELPFANYAT